MKNSKIVAAMAAAAMAVSVMAMPAMAATTFTDDGEGAFVFDNVDVLQDNDAVIVVTYSDEHDGWGDIEYYDLGLTVASGYGFKFRDIFSGEETGVTFGHFSTGIKAHDCRILRGTLVKK